MALDSALDALTTASTARPEAEGGAFTLPYQLSAGGRGSSSSSLLGMDMIHIQNSWPRVCERPLSTCMVRQTQYPEIESDVHRPRRYCCCFMAVMAVNHISGQELQSYQNLAGSA